MRRIFPVGARFPQVWLPVGNVPSVHAFLVLMVLRLYLLGAQESLSKVCTGFYPPPPPDSCYVVVFK